MKELVKKYFFEILIVVIVFINIFLHILPDIPLTIVLIIVSLFKSGIIGSFVLSSYAMPKLLGFVLYLYGITGVAAGIQLLFFAICLFLWLGKKSIKLYNFSECCRYIFLTLLVLLVSSLISTGGDYAFEKVRDTIINAVIAFFAYGFLFSNYKKCDFIRIGLYMIIYSLLLLMISPLLNSGSGPSGIFDFGYLRQQDINALTSEELTISYQMVGFVATMGAGIIMLESLKNKPNLLFFSICIVICTVISFYSGARQFVVTSLALFFLWIISISKKGLFGSFLFIVGTVLVVLVVGFLFSSEGMLGTVHEEGYLEASGRSAFILKGVSDFLDNPLIGVGYGRFEVFGDYGSYPHNLIVEMLCELGIIGTLLLFIITRRPLYYLIKKQPACIYLLIVYFLRSMSSGGIDSNIVLFSYVFAVLCLKGANFNCNVLKSINI